MAEAKSLAELFSAIPAVGRVAESAARGVPVTVAGVPGSARALLAAELAKRLSRTVLLVLSDPDEVTAVTGDVKALADLPVFGPWDTMPIPQTESGYSPLQEPSSASRQPAAVLVTDRATMESPAHEPMPEEKATLRLRNDGCRVANDAYPNKAAEHRTLEGTVEWLEDAGYERVDLVTEPGEYATRGGIVDIFPERAETPVRVEFEDDAVVSIRTFDPLSQRSTERAPEIEGSQGRGKEPEEGQRPPAAGRPQPAAVAVPTRRKPTATGRAVAETVPQDWVVVSESEMPGMMPLVTLVESDSGNPGIIPGAPRRNQGQPRISAEFSLGCAAVPSYLGNLALLRSEMASSGLRYFVAAGTHERRQRLAGMLPSEVEFIEGSVSAGFVCTGFALLTERELYGVPLHRVTRHRFKGVPVDNLVALRPDDLVVHVNHGVGRFEGTRRLTHGGAEKDYLVIRYAGNDRVYVPVESLGLLDRYVGASEGPVQLDRIGGRSWLLAKARAARASAEYAEELLEVEARRSLARGFAFGPDTEWQEQLESSFPYEETPDQLEAIRLVKRDMEGSRPMERLVCGDVGYGKTEVALRAAFKAACHCKQVALLVPTTILAYQHYDTFRRRLEPFPFRVEMLSRFVSPQKRRQVLSDLAEGKVDIVIGTHALLGPGVRFRDLGLLIVDEEQKFGVRQKDRLKKLRAHIDILSLTATPVPRTLYLALSGLRDISNINTPPPGRREVLTEVAEWDDDLISRYVEREVARGGQVFFVHNRIASLPAVTRRVKRLFPGLDIAVAHGQMPERKLEDIYLEFAAGKHKLLLSTAIIESGLDLPNVNTIIVDRADHFGLADLHQLRGRVGRSGRQAYALFLVPGHRSEPPGVRPAEDSGSMTEDARKRLSALLAYSRLGSGFRLALRDLEIRGAGDLLGTRQHGQVARVGLNLYAKMLREAVARLKGEQVPAEPELAVEVSAFLPKDYVTDGFERVALYRRLLALEDEAELKEFRAELVDRFGRYPPVVEDLFRIARVRIIARQKKLLRVELKSGRARLVGPERTEEFAADLKGLVARLEAAAV